MNYILHKKYAFKRMLVHQIPTPVTLLY